MKKFSLIAATSIALTATLFAQEPQSPPLQEAAAAVTQDAPQPAADQALSSPGFSWTPTLGSSLNLSQIYHDNWVTEGENAFNWEALIDGTLLGKRGAHEWNSELHLGYGQSEIGDREARKSLDKLQAESRYAYRITEMLSGYTGGHIQSQWTKSYSYNDKNGTKRAVSDYWDPGYLTLGIGVGFDPHPRIQNRVGFAYKNTWASEYFGWADDPETERVETWRGEPGLEYVLSMLWARGDMMELKSKFTLFANFEGADEVDLRWENSAKANFNKYVALAVGIELLYDRDLSADMQRRQNLSLKLQYNIFE